MGLTIQNDKLMSMFGGSVANLVNSHIPFTFFAASIIIVVAFFGILSYLNRRFFQGGALFPGLVVGTDNRISLSKFQAVLWTLVAIVSYITLKTVSVYCQVPMDTKIPPNLLILIGLNYSTLVLAKGITVQSVAKGNLKTMSARSSITDLYRTDNDNNTDLMKFQMLCWTLVAVVVYFVNFFSQFSNDAGFISFPDIENTLLYFMLVGHGAYLGDKAINVNKPRIMSVTPKIVQPGESFSIIGVFADSNTTFTINKTITLDVLGWNTTPGGLSSASVVMPDNNKIKASPVEITATTNGQTTEPFFVDVFLD